MKRSLLLAAALSLGCAASPVPRPPQPDAGDASRLEPAPWSAPRLAPEAVPPIYLQVWRSAENRQRCALLAPEPNDSASGEGAAARAATFSGGWAIAYDQPSLRSAFGVAGTGVSAWESGIYDDWPYQITWADSSRAGYGQEVANDPNWLAYLRIPGQDCLYNVWSRLGRTHLEQWIGRLRFVDAR